MAPMDLGSYKSLVQEWVKRKMDPQLLFQLYLSPRALFSLLLWYLKLTAMAHGTCSKAKPHNSHLLQVPKAGAEAPTLFPSHQRATACGSSRAQPTVPRGLLTLRREPGALRERKGPGALSPTPLRGPGPGALRPPRGPAAPPLLPGELETPHTSLLLCTTAFCNNSRSLGRASQFPTSLPCPDLLLHPSLPPASGFTSPAAGRGPGPHRSGCSPPPPALPAPAGGGGTRGGRGGERRPRRAKGEAGGRGAGGRLARPHSPPEVKGHVGGGRRAGCGPRRPRPRLSPRCRRLQGQEVTDPAAAQHQPIGRLEPAAASAAGLRAAAGAAGLRAAAGPCGTPRASPAPPRPSPPPGRRPRARRAPRGSPQPPPSPSSEGPPRCLQRPAALRALPAPQGGPLSPPRPLPALRCPAGPLSRTSLPTAPRGPCACPPGPLGTCPGPGSACYPSAAGLLASGAGGRWCCPGRVGGCRLLRSDRGLPADAGCASPRSGTARACGREHGCWRGAVLQVLSGISCVLSIAIITA